MERRMKGGRKEVAKEGREGMTETRKLKIKPNRRIKGMNWKKR